VIAKIESRAVADIEIISVIVTADVGEYDHGPVASAPFGSPECNHPMRELLSEGCRGVSAERLSYVLKHGIDVEPTDAPIWVSSIEKAMEGRAAVLITSLLLVGGLLLAVALLWPQLGTGGR